MSHSNTWKDWALLVLAGIIAFFASQYFRGGEAQNVAQWQQYVRVMECVGNLRERVSRLEGYHEHEKNLRRNK